mmetsp:Transcript_6203/g.12553  ORF Transcript_6203/g.12553 Transcript_6203/m.12553 type:complete len:211 (-) Transcript_6203:353-985(-)
MRRGSEWLQEMTLASYPAQRSASRFPQTTNLVISLSSCSKRFAISGYGSASAFTHLAAMSGSSSARRRREQAALSAVTKLCVTATESSRLATACSRFAGTTTVSPSRWSNSRMSEVCVDAARAMVSDHCHTPLSSGRPTSFLREDANSACTHCSGKMIQRFLPTTSVFHALEHNGSTCRDVPDPFNPSRNQRKSGRLSPRTCKRSLIPRH